MNLSEKWQTMLVALNARITILSKYPDVEEVKDYLGNVRLVSKKSLGDANEVEFAYACSSECCHRNSDLLVFPYNLVNGIKVYSTGTGTLVGSKTRRMYVFDNMGEIKRLGYSDTIIRKIDGCLQNNVLPVATGFEDDYWGLFQ